jgi:hypothetical protein
MTPSIVAVGRSRSPASAPSSSCRRAAYRRGGGVSWRSSTRRGSLAPRRRPHGPRPQARPRQGCRRQRVPQGYPSSGDPAGGTLCPIDRALARPTRTAKGKRARRAAQSRRERSGTARPQPGGSSGATEARTASTRPCPKRARRHALRRDGARGCASGLPLPRPRRVRSRPCPRRVRSRPRPRRVRSRPRPRRARSRPRPRRVRSPRTIATTTWAPAGRR